MKSLKQSIFLFLGMSFMLIFSYFNFTILRDIKDILVVTKAGVQMLPQLKMALIPSTLIVGLLLITLSWGGNIGRAFKVYFPINALILGAFAWLLYVNSPLVSNTVVIGGFYLWASVSMLLSVVLVWGFANQEYTFKTAAIQYPILGLLFLYSTLWATEQLNILSLQNPHPIMLAITVGLSLLTLAIYLWMHRCDLGAKERGINVSWVYWIALAVIVFSVKFAVGFPEIVHKWQLKRISPEPGTYIAFSRHFFWISDSWSIYAGLAGVVLGGILYFRGPKAWAKVSGLIALAMLLGGASFFYCTQTMTLSEQTIMPITLGYVFFVSLLGLFLLFKELAFFGFKRRNRFTAKIATDVIVYSLAPSAGSLIIMKTLQHGPNINLFAAIFVVAMIACLAGLYIIHRNLKNGLPSPEKIETQD